MYKIETLPNNLRIITREESTRESTSIGFWVGVGGRYECDRLKGAAHFLEHIVFKGSQEYACEEIKQSIEGVGGSLNAFTSEEQTCFYAKVPAKHLNSTFDVLADMVFFPKITKKDVQSEKTVIVEEIKMYHDLPQYHVMELLDGLLFPGHPLGKSLAGSAQTVLAMTHKDLKEFHSHYYHTDNIVISVCGNVSHDKIVRLIKKKLSKLQSTQGQPLQLFDEAQKKPRTHYEHRAIEQMHVALGMPAYDENDPKRYVMGLINVILGANMSSRLFVEVREKRGLAYSISSSPKSLHDVGSFMVRAGVDSTKIVDAVSVILKELNKLTKALVPEDEFRRAKDYLLGQLLLGLEDTMDHMLWIGEGMISNNTLKTRKKVVAAFKKITRKDIKDIAQEIFNAKKYNLAVIGPVTKKQTKELNDLMGVK